MNYRRLNRFHSTAYSRYFVSNFLLRCLHTELYKMDRKRFQRLLVFILSPESILYLIYLQAGILESELEADSSLNFTSK